MVNKQALFRVDVRHASSQQPDLKVFDNAPNQNPMALIEANSPNMLLLDIDYPSLRGLALARKITLHCPTTAFCKSKRRRIGPQRSKCSFL